MSGTGDMFGGPSVADVSLDDQISCVLRELEMRQRVYPRWVQRERMTQTVADTEILRMQAVLATLQRVRAAG